MFLKIKILERLTNSFNRYFKVNLFSRQTQNLVQFHSGGDDYNPPENAEGIGGYIGNNPAHGVAFAWRDSVERKSNAGEKRIYAVKEDGSVAGEVYLKNNGVIELNNTSDLKIVVNGNCDIKANTANIDATQTNLGVGGENIARKWDHVVVTVPEHGDCEGYISSAGVNTSI